MKKKLAILSAIAPFLTASKAFADITITPPAGRGYTDLGKFISAILAAILVIAALAAFIFLLLGGLSWITSGGDKERVEKARDKIQAAIVGIILVVIVVAILATLETVVFSSKLCFGLTCPVSIPTLLK